MDFLNLLGIDAANSAFNQQLFLTDGLKSTVDKTSKQTTDFGSLTSDRALKRKRLRRHPVWEHFGDIADKVVGCKLCSFNTVSAFSTNLKMHLKSHHKNEFIQVMEKELDQLIKETPDNQCSSPPTSSDLDTIPRIKRRRKTVQELQDTIDRCKQSIEREKGSRVASKNTHTPSCPRTSHLPSRLDHLLAQDSGFSAVEPAVQQPKALLSPVKDECLPTDQPNVQALFGIDSESQPSKIDLHSMILILKSLDQNDQAEKFVTEIRKNLRETALLELGAQLGSANVFFTNAFQDFCYTLDPSFTISADILHQNSSNSKSST